MAFHFFLVGWVAEYGAQKREQEDLVGAGDPMVQVEGSVSCRLNCAVAGAEYELAMRTVKVHFLTFCLRVD